MTPTPAPTPAPLTTRPSRVSRAGAAGLCELAALVVVVLGVSQLTTAWWGAGLPVALPWHPPAIAYWLTAWGLSSLATRLNRRAAARGQRRDVARDVSALR